MSDFSTYTIESAVAVLLLSIAFKIYRLRCHSSSDCCGSNVHFDAENPGGNSNV